MAVSNPKFQIYKSSGQFYFRLNARNGEQILASEGYTAKASCENGIRSVKENAQMESRFQKKTAENGQPYFVLIAGNNQVIGRSERYNSTSARDNGIASVMKNAPSAPVEDIT